MKEKVFYERRDYEALSMFHNLRLFRGEVLDIKSLH